ncbi:MAG: phosphosulfolactate synthase [Betaproteobacteria bacterium]|nr:phosphosulfolactate synthase [Betaproteobacteria bacterium]
MEPTFQSYLGIAWPERSRKPRQQGLTMVMDTGWPVSFVQSMMEQYGDYLDIAKIWDPHLRAPEKEVRKKIEVYNAHKVRVQPGGLVMEIARMQAAQGKTGIEYEIMRKLAEMGFSVIEISDTVTNTGRDMRRESDMVKRAQDLGFAVFGEVGKKWSEQDETRRGLEVINEEVTITQMLALLEAGAERVYWEGHLLRQVLGESAEELLAKRDSATQQVLRVAKKVGPERIIFEVSPLRPLLNRRTLQFWLVTLFGPEVNIGNARLEDLGCLEALRSGSHPVHGFAQAGDYPWVRALEMRKPADYKWWAEALSIGEKR